MGLAYVGTMCGSSATAETQDGGRMLEATASTAAHELGHNLNMAHDDDPSRNCKDICLLFLFCFCIFMKVGNFPAWKRRRDMIFYLYENKSLTCVILLHDRLF